MVKLQSFCWGGGNRKKIIGIGTRDYRECGGGGRERTRVSGANCNYSNCQRFLLSIPCGVGGGGGGQDGPGCWLLFLLLLMFSSVSQECPTQCQCLWKFGKESVSCFRASLSKIPQGLDPGTQVLNMSGNALRTLPANVFLSLNLLNLQKIFLPGCELFNLDRLVFAKLTNLVELDLSRNRLEIVPSHTFAQIPELRELKINANPISRVSNDAFVTLRRLVRLELTDCQLGTIEPWAFRDLPALEWLRLDNNRLLTVQADSFFSLQSLHGLKMNGNPWNCSCALKPLRDWMLRNNVPFEGVPPICQEPPRLRGKPWDRLQLQDFACLPKLETSSEEERIRRVVEGHNTSFVCRLQATADTHVTWLNVGSKGATLTNGSSWSGGGGGLLISESFSWRSEDLDEFGGVGRGRGGAGAGIVGGTPRATGVLDRSLGLKISVLTVIRTKLRDAGVYQCVGQSRAGSVATNFSLIVLQDKAENLTGRLLFTGTLVAALLTLAVCLLLSCFCLVGRHRRTTTTTLSVHATLNANSNSNCRAVLNHNNHNHNSHQEKVELNHINVNAGANQNGGNNLLANNHSHSNNHANNPHNRHPMNIGLGNLNSNPNANPNLNKSNAAQIQNNPNANINIGHTRPPERGKDYKALPTTDPDDSFNENDNDNDNDEDDEDDSSASAWGVERERERKPRNTVTNAKKFSNREELTLSMMSMSMSMSAKEEIGSKPGVMSMSSQMSSQNQSLDQRRLSSASCSSNNNTPTFSSPTRPMLPQSSVNPPINCSNNSNSQLLRRNSREIPGQSGWEKFPDLIDEKMSVSSVSGGLLPATSAAAAPSTTIKSNSNSSLHLGLGSSSTADFVSLPRPNRNHELRPSYFHRRMNSESQSLLLGSDQQHLHSSYGNSLDSNESLLSNRDSSSNLLPAADKTSSGRFFGHSVYSQHNQHSSSYSHRQHPHNNPHSNPHHNHHHHPHQRLSMPTSPLHDSQAVTYDYHAAKLAEFLEEYRLLQLELMRMSASMNQSQQQQQQSSESSNANNLSSGGSNSNSNSIGNASNSPFPGPGQGQGQGSGQLDSPQLKGILKNPNQNNNNNYMA